MNMERKLERNIIRAGEWITRSGKFVIVDSEHKDGSFSGFYEDEDENGKIMGCIELGWNSNGNDIDKMHCWDLIRRI